MQKRPRITEKYERGEGRSVSIESRAADERVVMRLVPVRIVAVASVEIRVASAPGRI